MTTMFNAEEVFEMAAQVEREGAAFYRAAGERFEEPRLRELFRQLAVMEQEHERTFEQLRRDLLGAPDPVDWSDADPDAVDYLRALASTEVFDRKSGKRSVRGDETAADVLRMAISFENQSIAFYQGLKEAMPEALGREHITALIREEMKHVTMLSRMLEHTDAGAPA